MSNEKMEQDVVDLTHKILDKLGLEIPDDELDDYDFLRSDTFYIQIFKTIVGNSPTLFDEDKFMQDTENMTQGQRIQALIDKLDSEILQIDLSHIQGENIAKGEIKDITNILQLLDLLSVSEDQHEGQMEEKDLESNGKINLKGEIDYEDALNNSESLEEERNLNIESSNRAEKMSGKKQKANGNLHDFGDAADAIKTEEDLMQVMERDGEIQFTHDNREIPEDRQTYDEKQVLEPKMGKMRKKTKKSNF